MIGGKAPVYDPATPWDPNPFTWTEVWRCAYNCKREYSAELHGRKGSSAREDDGMSKHLRDFIEYWREQPE
jgi:hypothetical protein